jgi:hypothetical protein
MSAHQCRILGNGYPNSRRHIIYETRDEEIVDHHDVRVTMPDA